jgi:hypothetical protein
MPVQPSKILGEIFKISMKLHPGKLKQSKFIHLLKRFGIQTNIIFSWKLQSQSLDSFCSLKLKNQRNGKQIT